MAAAQVNETAVEVVLAETLKVEEVEEVVEVAGRTFKNFLIVLLEAEARAVEYDRGRGRGSSNFPSRSDGPDVFHPGYAPVVDKAVTDAEDAFQKSLTTKKATGPSMPLRPGYGTRGAPVTLWANYFHMKITSKANLYRYNISVKDDRNHDVAANGLIKRVIEILIKDTLQSLDQCIVTDFRSTLLSHVQLSIPNTGFDVRYYDAVEDGPSADSKHYTVVAAPTGIVPISSLLDQSTSSNVSSLFGAKQEAIQALNILVGHQPKQNRNIYTIGRNAFASSGGIETDQISLGDGLIALRAFVFSVRAATERMLVNVHVKNFAFYETGQLDQVARNFLQNNRGNIWALETFLKRVSVEVMHIAKKTRAGVRIPRFKIIDGLASPRDGRGLANPPVVPSRGAGPKDVKFFLRSEATKASEQESSSQSTGKGRGKNTAKPRQDPSHGPGRYVTVYDFFRNTYGIEIKDTRLPVINVGSSQNPTYLPMQVCEIRPGQPVKGQISPTQTQKMISFAVRRPGPNARSICSTGLNVLGLKDSNPFLEALNITIDPQMTAVLGRVLQPPSINYAAKRPVRPGRGSWNLMGIRFHRGSTLQKWTYLYIVHENDRPVFENSDHFKQCIGSFTSKLREVGINIAECNYNRGGRVVISSNDQHPQQKIDNALRTLAGLESGPPELVFVVLPTNDNTWIYNRVKYLCDVELGMLNQCVIDSKFRKDSPQYNANVALKMNLKLGGINHTISEADYGGISMKDTMMVGVDVTHPSPGSSSDAPSVAAIVSSSDEHLGQWRAEMSIQAEARKEMVDSLTDLVLGSLRYFRKKNQNRLPQNIIVYRDGVSEGQYSLVLDNELPSVQKAAQLIYPAPDTKKGLPRISIVIVGKRHHTRFYATKSEDPNADGNPENGTVVDRGVTEAANWDFFLQAHTALKGTARPAHYYVIYDEVFRSIRPTTQSGNAANLLEQLSHNMCYLFARATKAVSICPPAYYADLVCERARCYLSDKFAPTGPNSSAASMVSGEQPSVPSEQSIVTIHERVRDKMFYI